ncbi:Peptidyl-prolyl cis-trans isomerase FKBP4 [Pseudolycoriella hygida]|uniref:peptidylprolyl isomerase n=2 Tax=Pseudolycoriella hygida TaxID=35572 RepID=A0A9Q0RYU4_9DIPT|nr:Peptidyl-prolyl cis-trans isomerase FKBP4 [Pseudolycoriella hygida]
MGDESDIDINSGLEDELLKDDENVAGDSLAKLNVELAKDEMFVNEFNELISSKRQRPTTKKPASKQKKRAKPDDTEISPNNAHKTKKKAVVLCPGCKMSHSNEPRISEAQLDLTSEQNGGVLKEIVTAGKYDGKPIPDDGVLIHVTGSLKVDGKVFFDTRKMGKPWKTKLGSAELPAALDMAIRTMKKHEIARINCKPEYCYKDVRCKQQNFVCEVPANSEVIFEVELMDFRFYDLTKDKHSGVVLMRRFEKGNGYYYPTYGSEVCCDICSYDDYKGSNFGIGDTALDSPCVLYNPDDDRITDYHLENVELSENCEYSKVTIIHTDSSRLMLMRGKSLKFIEKNDLTFTLGEGVLERIPEGVEIAIENMLVGEKALFMVRYDYLKDMLTDDEFVKYKENSEFYTFIITLKSCKRAQEFYEMTSVERIEEGLACKLKGNYFLTEKSSSKLAVRRYQRAIDSLELSIDLDGANAERDEILFACYLNICKAFFDAKTPELCEKYLIKALKMKPQSEKAMYRNSLLFMERKMYGEAKVHLENLLKLYPSNKAAIKLLKECESIILKQSSAESHMYKTMATMLFN